MSQQATRIRERKTKLTLGFDWEDAFSDVFGDTHAQSWACGWSPTSKRCLRFHCHNSAPCGGYPGDQQSASPRPAPVSEDE